MNEENHDAHPGSDPLESNVARLLGQPGAEAPKLDPARRTQMLKDLLRRREELANEAPSRPAGSPSPPGLLANMAKLAAVILVAGLGLWAVSRWDQEKPEEDLVKASPPVAKVTEVPEPDLIPGTIEQLDSVTRHRLPDGTVLIVKPGTQYVAAADREVTLHSGALYCIVAKDLEEPFRVITAGGEAVALGTRFMVETAPVAAGREEGEAWHTRVAVAQGKVRFASEEVSAGEECLQVSGEKPRRGPAPRLSYLVNWAREALEAPPPMGPAVVGGVFVSHPHGQEEKLSLRRYHVDVFIEDGIARTTVDQTFFNHLNWNTEGTFYFPLSPGASVSRLAMYVNGVRNEGGMVERGRGQQIYNEIKYQRRDPALLEKMEGNNYKLRIFPLEGRQEKRIFLSYTMPLEELYGRLRYWFPMDHTHANAGSFSLRVRVKNGAPAYEVKSSTHELRQEHDGDDLVLQFEAENVKPDRDLLLHLLPKKQAANVPELTTFAKEGHRYFFAKITPRLEATVTGGARQWYVLNDVSASRSRKDLETQAGILDRLLVEADDADELALFHISTRVREVTEGLVPVRSQTAAALSEEMRRAQPLGATHLAKAFRVLGEAMARDGAGNPHILYLGDGVATDGELATDALASAIAPGAVFVSVGVGKRVDSTFLQRVAGATGGAHFLINPNEDLNWRVFDLLASLNTPRITDLQWDYLDSEGTSQAVVDYANRSTIAGGETLAIAARTEGPLPGAIRLTGKVNGGPWGETMSFGEARDGASYIPWFWARQHIDALLAEGAEVHREEIVSLSKELYVMTPHTSLIVLEDDEMYQEFQVEKGRTDHWAAYPAPEKIDVVREPKPSPWDPSQSLATIANPQSSAEIAKSVLFYLPGRFRPASISTKLTWVVEGDETRTRATFANAVGSGGFFPTGGSLPRSASRHAAALKPGSILSRGTIFDRDRRSRKEVGDLDLGTSFGAGRGGNVFRTSGRDRQSEAVLLASRLETKGRGSISLRAADSSAADADGEGILAGAKRERIVDAVLGEASKLGAARRFGFSWQSFSGDISKVRRRLPGHFGPDEAATQPLAFGLMEATAADWLRQQRENGKLDDQSAASLRKELQELDQRMGPYAFSAPGSTGPRIFLPVHRYGYFDYPRRVESSILHAAVGLRSDRQDVLDLLADFEAGGVEDTADRNARAVDLLVAARAQLAPERIFLEEDAQGYLIAPGGKFKITRRIPLYLEEEIVSDGRHLYHIYPELGMAGQRPLTKPRRRQLAALAPHWIPDIEDLPRDGVLSLVDEDANGFVIRLAQAWGEVEMACRHDGRLSGCKWIQDGEETLSETFHYGQSGEVHLTSITRGETERSLTYRIELPGKEEVNESLALDLSHAVVFELPLRRPQFYGEQLNQLEKREDAPIAERVRLLRHLTMAEQHDYHTQYSRRYYAGRVSAEKLDHLFGEHDLLARKGDLALFKAVNYVSKFTEETLDPGTDYRRHLADCEKLSGSLVRGKASPEEVREFIQKWPDSPLLLTVIRSVERSREPGHLQKRQRIWLELARHGKSIPDRMAAILYLTQATTEKSTQEEIADLLPAVHRQALEEGVVLLWSAKAIGHIVQTEGQPQWNALVQESFDECVQRENIPGLASLYAMVAAGQRSEDREEWCHKLEEAMHGILGEEQPTVLEWLLGYVKWGAGDVVNAVPHFESLLATCRQAELPISANLLTATAHAYFQTGHKRNPDLKKKEHTISDNLPATPAKAKMNYISLEMEALALLEDSARENGRVLSPGSLRSRFRALWQLRHHLKENEHERQAQLEEILHRWSGLDPEDDRPLVTMASSLVDDGDGQGAWECLSTIIDRKPRDAASYGAVARWHLARDQPDQAQQFYAKAHTFDTATPDWKIARLRVLCNMGPGRRAEAKALYKELVQTKWAPGLERRVPRQFDVSLLPPLHSPGNRAWAKTETSPAKSWAEPDFDDSVWERPGNRFPLTKDKNASLWLRHEFNAPASFEQLDPLELRTRTNHLKATVYINGIWAAEVGRISHRWERRSMARKARQSIRRGSNVVAVKISQIKSHGPPPYNDYTPTFPRDFDLSIYEVIKPDPAWKK